MRHERLDVFIPLAEIDLPVLNTCVRSVRKHMKPPPNRIVIVGDPDLEAPLREIDKDHLEFCNRDRLRDIIPLERMPTIACGGKSRTGWYYQQFVKWAVRHESGSESYVVVDADIAFAKPIRFLRDGKYVLYRSREHHSPYFTTFERLLGYKPEPDLSFIVGFMIFNKVLLDELIAKIETRSGITWYNAILNAIDRNELSSFSECETYGNFLRYEHPNSCESVPVRCLVCGDAMYSGLFLSRQYLSAHRIVAWGARLAGYTTIQYHWYHPMNRNPNASSASVT